jgi:hypothetical protein
MFHGEKMRSLIVALALIVFVVGGAIGAVLLNPSKSAQAGQMVPLDRLIEHEREDAVRAESLTALERANLPPRVSVLEEEMAELHAANLRVRATRLEDENRVMLWLLGSANALLVLIVTFVYRNSRKAIAAQATALAASSVITKHLDEMDSVRRHVEEISSRVQSLADIMAAGRWARQDTPPDGMKVVKG